MQRRFRLAMRHVIQYRIGYAVGMFITIAAMTCGCLQGNSCGDMMLQMNLRNVLWIVACESVWILGLLLAATHPFGCALSAAVLMTKGYQSGLLLGWWTSQHPQMVLWVIPLGIQCCIGLCAMLTGACITAYAALRVYCQSYAERFRWHAVIFVIEMCCVIVRCGICALAV